MSAPARLYDAQPTELLAATDVLGSSLDYEETLAQLANLLVPHLGDWCSIDLMDDPDTIRNVAVAHVDPMKVELARQLQQRFPPDPKAKTGIPHVVETGESEFYPEITDELLTSLVDDEEILGIIRELGLHSSITAPLTARGRRFGAISLISAESGRIYTDEDVAVVEDLGKRAGLAIENARLFQAERDAAERIRLLAEATDILNRSLDYETSLDQLARLVVDRLADTCIVDIVDTNGSLRRVTAVPRDPALQPLMDVIRDRPPRLDRPENPIVRAISTGEIQWGAASEDLARENAIDEAHFEAGRRLQLQGFVSAPLVARGRTVGVLSLGSTEPYSEFTVELVRSLAVRAAVAIDNARLYDERSKIAATLQQSLLPPKLPAIPGVELASIFHPGIPGEVGGDFYDVFELPEGEWAFVIGDVCGRGSEAAALTSLARYGVRAGAIRGEEPSQVLEMLNQEVLHSGADRFCTLVYATLRLNDGRAVITVARGGHPSPLVLRGSGELEVVEPPGALIGVFPKPHFEDRRVVLDPGDAVVFYTDGASEKDRRRSGEAELMALIKQCAGLSAHRIVERLDKALTRPSPVPDDIAVMVVRLELRQ